MQNKDYVKNIFRPLVLFNGLKMVYIPFTHTVFSSNAKNYCTLGTPIHWYVCCIYYYASEVVPSRVSNWNLFPALPTDARD